MKSIVFISLFISISMFSFVQHDFSINPMPKLAFLSGINKPDTSYLSFNSTKKSTDFLALIVSGERDKAAVGILKYKSKMPIAKPKGLNWNMPVAVPDSSVNYAIREKRIELYILPKNEGIKNAK